MARTSRSSGQEHRGQEPAEKRQDCGHLALGHHGHAGAEHGDDEHEREGGADLEEVVVGVAREERQVAETQTQTREPFRQIRHVAATVEPEAGPEQDDTGGEAEAQACARADQVVLDGELHGEGRGEEDGDHPDPRRPACADPLLEIETDGGRRGGHGLRRGRGCRRLHGGSLHGGFRDAPCGRKRGLGFRGGGGGHRRRNRLGRRRDMRLGRSRGVGDDRLPARLLLARLLLARLLLARLLLESPDAEEEIPNALFEGSDALRGRGLARTGFAVA